MKKSLLWWSVVGFVVTGVAGTVLHFVYDLSNHNIIIGLFSAINESVWEHMKLLFFPTALFSFVKSIYLKKEYQNFWYSQLKGICKGLITIPTIYYFYTGIFGINVDWFNITIFFVATAVTYITEWRTLKKDKKGFFSEKISIAIMGAIAMLFFAFTFVPPQIPIFEDPQYRKC